MLIPFTELIGEFFNFKHLQWKLARYVSKCYVSNCKVTSRSFKLRYRVIWIKLSYNKQFLVFFSNFFKHSMGRIMWSVWKFQTEATSTLRIWSQQMKHVWAVWNWHRLVLQIFQLLNAIRSFSQLFPVYWYWFPKVYNISKSS